MTRESLPACAVLLAGGRGTRFWPRSRVKTPKQLLNIAGRITMLRATVERLQPIFGVRNFWAVTNVEQAPAVRRELRGIPASHILAEPTGRNTTAAIGLAAIHLAHEHGDALMAVVPADSHVADAARYREIVSGALDLSSGKKNMVVLGIPPTRPETGYGYIERGNESVRARSVPAYSVRRFIEKPELRFAQEYYASDKYLWNAGMFFWRVSVFLQTLRRFRPTMHDMLLNLGKTIGTRQYSSTLGRIYPRLENISVDYAIMEPATRPRTGGDHRGAGIPTIFVIPARVGWSDIGSWGSVYELLAPAFGANVSDGPSFLLDAQGNYVWSPHKFVAAVGVRNLVIVETDDALLVCSREHSQDVGKVVKWLEKHKHQKLL